MSRRKGQLKGRLGQQMRIDNNDLPPEYIAVGRSNIPDRRRKEGASTIDTARATDAPLPTIMRKAQITKIGDQGPPHLSESSRFPATMET